MVSVMISIRTRTSLLLALFLGMGIFSDRAQAQTNPKSHPALSPPASDSDSSSWLFPIDKLDEALPSWLHIGGEYRARLEGPISTGFANTSDFYVLDRLRVTVAIQPKDWLTFYGEVQDARIFFNHHIPNANPLEDSWTLWQSYVQVGSSSRHIGAHRHLTSWRRSSYSLESARSSRCRQMYFPQSIFWW